MKVLGKKSGWSQESAIWSFRYRIMDVTVERGHCDHGSQLLLFTDEGTEAQRFARVHRTNYWCP